MQNSLFPFSQPKQIALAKVDIQKLQERAFAEAEGIIIELSHITNAQFKLTIAKRKTGQAMNYFWRFRGSKDRKFYRLSAPVIQEYCCDYGHDMNVQFRRVESVLLQVNATLKYTASMESVISEYHDNLDQP